MRSVSLHVAGTDSRVMGGLLLGYLEESSPAAAVGGRGDLSFRRHDMFLW